jgi:hypothetical protein
MHYRKTTIFAVMIALTAIVCVDLAKANAPQAQFHMGRLWMNPEYDGAEGWSGSCFQYPGGIPKEGTAGADNEIKRGWIGNGQKFGTYLFSKNWTDPNGTAWNDAASYFHRSMNYNYPVQYTDNDESGNMNYLYAVSVQEHLRWERPVVSIQPTTDPRITVQFFPGEEDLETMPYKLPDHGGVLARPTPVIDPSLVTEEVIEMVWRYIQGVELHRDMYGYPYGSPHQDYVLQDITLTNNGISGNVPGSPVLTDQNITNMVWVQAFDRRDQQAPGSQQGEDIHGMYIEPWGAGNRAAILFWDGDAEDEPGPDYGDPIENPFYEGHMAANCVTLIGPLFTSVGPGADYATDDLNQPAFNMVYYERGIDIAGKPYSPPKNDTPPVGATDQRELLTLGTFQVPLDVDYRDFPATTAVKDEDPGPTALLGYGRKGTTLIDGTASGPDDHGWDIAFGESVRIVQMVAGGGIDQEEARRITQTWITKKAAGDAADTWMSIADQALVQTGVDTAMKAAALAAWNFSGALPAGTDKAKLALTDIIDPKPVGHGEFDVPEAPRPPGGIYVRGVIGFGMEVRWTTEAETYPDFDTGVADMVGYRVYRQSGARTAPWELVADGVPGDFPEIGSEGDLPAGRYYQDTQTTPGVDYWYSVTAYDDGSQNWGSTSGESLESSRWWTWTGYSHIGVTAQDWGPIGPPPTVVNTTTWTADNSPYRITNTMLVPSGATLTIEPGVDVLFDEDMQFRIEGRLVAIGTETDSIRFMRGTASEWGGLRISGGDSSTIHYARISDVVVGWGSGIFCNGTRLYLNHCTISGNSADQGGAMCVEGSTVTLDTCTIRENVTAKWGGGGLLFSNSLATLNSCVITDNTANHDGGGLLFKTATGVMNNCTVCGNTAGDNGGIGNTSSALRLTNSIVWENSLPEIRAESGGRNTVRYSNIKGGYPGTGNIDVDPLFVDAAAGDFHLQPISPCIDAGDPASPLDPDGTRVDMGAFYVHQEPMPQPTFVRVSDVPADQGGKVLIRWRASSLDTNANTLPHYSVWRAVPEGVAKLAGRKYRTARIAETSYTWEWIASPLAHRFLTYAYTTPTMFDSMSTGPAIHQFMVSAHTSNLDTFYDSYIVSGYSVDNLAPAAPVMKPAYYDAGKVTLSWTRNTESDLSHYLVYRGAEYGFDFEGTDPIGTTMDTVFVDDSPPAQEVSFYLVCALDIHENIGATSNRVAVDRTAVELDLRPKEFALSQNVPNPFNPTTTIRYALPDADHVQLVIYDVNGRVVKHLINRSMNAGYHTAKWNGRDRQGRMCASGVYFCRLTGDTKTLVRRMVLVR